MMHHMHSGGYLVRMLTGRRMEMHGASSKEELTCYKGTPSQGATHQKARGSSPRKYKRGSYLRGKRSRASQQPVPQTQHHALYAELSTKSQRARPRR